MSCLDILELQKRRNNINRLIYQKKAVENRVKEKERLMKMYRHYSNEALREFVDTEQTILYMERYIDDLRLAIQKARGVNPITRLEEENELLGEMIALSNVRELMVQFKRLLVFLKSARRTKEIEDIIRICCKDR